MKDDRLKAFAVDTAGSFGPVHIDALNAALVARYALGVLGAEGPVQVLEKDTGIVTEWTVAQVGARTVVELEGESATKTADMDAVVLLSGGVDSTVLAYKLRADGFRRILAVSFDYGQRNRSPELYAALQTVHALKLEHEIVALPIFADAGLAGRHEVPNAPTSDVEATKPVVVPGRNFVFLSVAIAMAATRGIPRVYFGAHAGDAAAFPDCRRSFLRAIDMAATSAQIGVHVVAPFVEKTRREIVDLGESLAVPWSQTYSCYVGGVEHCGACGACLTRFMA